MPNNTDLTVFKMGGIAGMNFAFIEHPEYYHTTQDTVEHLDPVSVQEQGRYALSLTRWFGSRDLREHAAGNAVYFSTAFTPLIVYPVGFAKILSYLILIAALTVWTKPWIGVPLLLLAILHFWIVTVAPGVSYLIAWPLAGAIVATFASRWRVVMLSVCAAPVFLLIVPLLPSLIVALTLRGAVPILAIAAVFMLICLFPQFTFLTRKCSVCDKI
jgi:hypothetical protein